MERVLFLPESAARTVTAPVSARKRRAVARAHGRRHIAAEARASTPLDADSSRSVRAATRVSSVDRGFRRRCFARGSPLNPRILLHRPVCA